MFLHAVIYLLSILDFFLLRINKIHLLPINLLTTLTYVVA